MPPKKEAGGGKDGAEDTAAEKAKLAIAQLEEEVAQLQRQLHLKATQAEEAREAERLWRERYRALAPVLEHSKSELHDIITDSLRQYKDMQERGVQQLQKAHMRIAELTAQVEMRDTDIQQLTSAMAQQEQQVQAQLSDSKAKMSEMQHEFAGLMKELWDRLQQHQLQTSYQAHRRQSQAGS